MALALYLHPLSSYCHKVLIALYENQVPFEPRISDLSDPAQRAALAALWPMAKFPLLRDEARGRTVPESSIIIEYLAQHYPGKVALIPLDPESAREVRARDRFFDLYLHDPMQKIIGDRLRPADRRDPVGVEQARGTVATALDMLEREMAERDWAAGAGFSMADCAAAPPLFYIENHVASYRASHPNVARYLERLQARPSYARALKDAEPYFSMVPK